MSTIAIPTVGTSELWEQFKQDPMRIYTDVAHRMTEAGIEDKPTMSRVLEEVSPSEANAPLDAFERLMQEAGIRTHSDPAAGYWASRSSAFLQNPGTKALFTEFFARNWRKVSYGVTNQEQRAILLSNDSAIGSWDRPWASAQTPRPDRRIEPAIPLSELVSATTPIDGDGYRTYYLTYDAAQLRDFRVGESAEIPLATITGSERTVRLKKYGRGLRATYETMRRLRVDRMAWYIQWMAVQSEVDKVAAVLDVLVNGDGNSSTTPATHNLTTLDPATTANNLTVTAWLAFKMKFVQPYVLTTALMQEAVALKLAMLDTGSANIPLIVANLGGLGTGVSPINRFADTTRYGWLSDAPSGKIVAFDNRFAVERVTEIGSEITEMERFITNQTQVMVMSEVEGYGITDANGTKILDLAT